MKTSTLIMASTFCLLLIIFIINIFILVIHSHMNHKNKSIIYLFSLFFIICLALGIVMLGYIKFSNYPITLHYHFTCLKDEGVLRVSFNDVCIAYGMDFIAFMMACPILLIIFHQIFVYIVNNDYILLTILLSFLDIFIILIVLYLYLIKGNYFRIYGHAHYLFPLVLGCAVGSLFPAIISTYMIIVTDGLYNNMINTIRTCIQGLIEALSMLGIAVTFASLSFEADWPISVGFVYWGTYIFMLISLSLIVFNVILNIRRHNN